MAIFYSKGFGVSKDLKIACGEGSILKILSVQKPGGKIMNTKDG